MSDSKVIGGSGSCVNTARLHRTTECTMNTFVTSLSPSVFVNSTSRTGSINSIDILLVGRLVAATCLRNWKAWTLTYVKVPSPILPSWKQQWAHQRSLVVTEGN